MRTYPSYKIYEINSKHDKGKFSYQSNNVFKCVLPWQYKMIIINYFEYRPNAPERESPL